MRKTINTFCNRYLTREILFIFLIFILGFLLRSYNFSKYFNFSPELADNLFDIKKYSIENIIPLVGPSTSHPWLKFGPLYYWILLPAMNIGNWNPLIAGYLGLIVGSFIILINYYYTSILYGRKIATISSLIISISPLWIDYSKDARFYFFVTLFFYPFFYYLFKYYKYGGSSIVKSMFFLGLMLNFHLSPIIYILLIIYIFLKRKEKLKLITMSMLALLITQTPFLIFDLKSGLSMTKNFIFWIPYRLAGFTYLYPKNNPSLDGVSRSANSLIEFIGKSVFYEHKLWIFVFILIIITFFVNLKNKNIFLLSFLMIINVLAIFVHGDGPTHYLIPIFSALPILIAYFLRKIRYRVIGLLFITMFIVNSNYYFKAPDNYIDISMQRDVVDTILNNTNPDDYDLRRVGPYDQFEKQFAQNYLYLLELKGSKPIAGEDVLITIHEGNQVYNKREDIIFSNNELIVTKSILK